MICSDFDKRENAVDGWIIGGLIGESPEDA